MTGRACRAGFVLAGGKSSRMGTDKALLTFRGRPLIQHIAEQAAIATGEVTLIGDEKLYGGMGYAAMKDRRPGWGPLAGIETALDHTRSEWNLVLACDMPGLRAGVLERLCQAAEGLPDEADSLVPRGPSERLQPLSAVYRARCLTSAREALARGERKVITWVAGLRTVYWPTEEADGFQNVNTPLEWSEFLASHGA